MDKRNFFYKLIWERESSPGQPVSMYNAAKNNLYLLQRMCLEKKLNVHSGCVNTICWNSTGQYLLSGSDDLHLCITDAFTNEIKASIRTGHATNIFSAKYLPGTADSQVISCSGDGVLIYTDLLRPDTSTKNIFDCQEESVYDIATVPNDSHTFLTCSHDQTVRWYDLRVKTSCLKHQPSHYFYSRSSLLRQSHRCLEDVLIKAEHPVTAIAVNGLMPWQLAIGCSDSIVRIYDRRMLSTRSLGGVGCGSGPQVDSSVLAKFTYDGINTTNRITSLAYSRNCQQLLASFSNDFLYLFDLNDVRNTIKLSADENIIPDKSDRTECAFKRFRLRGDWSDTGPNALTSDEIRAAGSRGGRSTAAADDQSSSTTAASTSTANTTASSSSAARPSGSASSAAAAPAPSFSSSAQATITDSNPSVRSRNPDARIRHLNNILSLFLRSSFGGSASRSSSLLESLAREPRRRNVQLNRSGSASASEAQMTATTSAATAAAVASGDTTTTAASSLADPSTAPATTSSSTGSGPFRPPSSTANMDMEDSGNAQAGDAINSSSAQTSSNPELSQPSFFIRLFDDSDWGDGNSNSNNVGGGQPGEVSRNQRNDNASSQDSPLQPLSGRIEVEVAEANEPEPVEHGEAEEENALENELLMDDDYEGDGGEVDSDTTNDSVFHRPNHPPFHHRHQSPGTSRTSRSSSSNDSTWHQQFRQSSSRFGAVPEASSHQRPPPMARDDDDDDDDDDEMDGHSMKYRRTEESVEREKRQKTYKINAQIFKGHRNARTVIKEATFWGDDFIVSGSDCGHIFFWSVKDQKLVMIIEGDHHVVNCLQPHPTHPILASSGIDYDIKIWSPQSEENMFDEKKAKKVMDRNKTLLEESRDTVTVPARFVLSLFSTLRHRQNTNNSRNRRDAAEEAAAAGAAEAPMIIPNSDDDDHWNDGGENDADDDDDDDEDEDNQNNNNNNSDNMDEDIEG